VEAKRNNIKSNKCNILYMWVSSRKLINNSFWLNVVVKTAYIGY